MNSQKKWKVPLVDCDDGSGDCYLEFPLDLLAHFKWKIGDLIDLELVENCIYVHKVDEVS